jgi:hypothetical protein
MTFYDFLLMYYLPGIPVAFVFFIWLIVRRKKNYDGMLSEWLTIMRRPQPWYATICDVFCLSLFWFPALVLCLCVQAYVLLVGRKE